MNIDFEKILFYATLISGLICLADLIYFAPRRKRAHWETRNIPAPLPVIFDYAYSFFPVLLIVFLLRSFLYEPFRIPSGSLEPTLTKGDFIVVNKFDYGIRLPVLHKKIMGSGTPARGDIIVFRWPPNPSYDFIKRVIGLPGDHIKYIQRELYINGKQIPQQMLDKTTSLDEFGNQWVADKKSEDLLGVKHEIFIDPSKTSADYKEIVVPEGMYFVMGDNRDNSADSRYWGFVPDENIVGKAVMVWLSWNGNDHSIRWNRIGKIIR